MDNRRDNTRTQSVSTEERAATSQPNTWVIGPDESDCDHDEEHLRHVGDDGITSYYRCEVCGSVIVSREPIHRAVRPVT